MLNRRIKASRPQTIVEYVLIIAIVVVAAISILSIFSDTVRGKIAGIVKVLDPSNTTASTEMGTSSKSVMEGLSKDGLSSSSSSTGG